MKHPFLTSCGAIIAFWILGLLIAKFAFGGSQEAIWEVTFYGMIFAAVVLPLGIGFAIVRWFSKPKKRRTSRQSQRPRAAVVHLEH